MTAAIFTIAIARSKTTDDPAGFRRGFRQGLRADQDDAELELAALTRVGDAFAAAGLIEGLAAVRAEAGWPLHSSAPHWRRHPGFGGGK